MLKYLALALMLSTSAMAADMAVKARPPAPAAFVAENGWSGIYLFGYADYAVDLTNSQLFVPGTATLDLGGTNRGPGLGGGFEALLQIPSSSWVVGLSADMGWLNATANGGMTVNGQSVFSLSNATNYLGGVEGELGYALDNGKVLLSALGGFGFGGAKSTLSSATLSQGINGTSTGWVAGGKVAYALTANLSAFLKTEYYALGSKQITIAGTQTSSTPFNFLVTGGGLAYKF